MVQPTLTIQDAASSLWDVLVIGAGPAGSVAARALALTGCRVLLVDRAAFPRWKVCGACLSGRALSTLAEAGLADLPARLDAVPLRTFQLAGRHRAATVALPAGVALSRTRFDAALVEEAIRAGAAFLPQTAAALGECHADHRVVVLRQREAALSVAARAVIAADGLGGTIAPGRRLVRPGSRIGAGIVADNGPSFYEPGTIYMACGRAGYLGLVRLEDGRLDIAAAFDPALMRQAHPGPAAADLLAQTGWPAIPDLAELPWRGTPALTRQAGMLGAERLFVLGDAAGYIEPFTGEGMAWAMAGALALAPLAARAVHGWHPRLLACWAARHRQVVTRRQGVCRAAAEVLRRPVLTAATLLLLRMAPWLARPVVWRLNS
jgi:flavin-dependent dehydrogenase